MKNLLYSVGILIIVLSIIFAVYVSADNISYSATIETGANVVITSLSTSFSGCSPGGNCTAIANSLRIQNLGNAIPITGLNVSFLTNISTIYGLNSSSNIINGTNFRLNNTVLLATNLSKEIVANTSITSNIDFNISAGLSIPAGQTAGTYTGTVLISWTNT